MVKNLVDYIGKLNEHNEYLKMLDILEKKCDYVGITYYHEIVKKFEKDIIKHDKTFSWWGIETSLLTDLYYIKASKELFEFLKSYETFCKYIFGDYEKRTADVVKLTSFGPSDIAFFDKDNNILLRTNTHEGFVYVSQDVDKTYNEKTY